MRTFVILALILYGVRMGNLCSCIQEDLNENNWPVLLAQEFKDHLDECMRDEKSSLVQSRFLVRPFCANAMDAIEAEQEVQLEVLCADLGGTSLKLDIYTVASKTGRTEKVTKETVKYDIPKTKEEIAERTIYEFMSEKIIEFINGYRNAQRTEGAPMRGALTFSYPLEKCGDGFKVSRFTKQFNWVKAVTDNSPEIPLDELNKLTNRYVRFSTIANDTTALGIWACNMHEDAIGGFVLGTGMNCSYLDNIAKSENKNEKIIKAIYNTECGGFKFSKVKSIMNHADRKINESNPAEKDSYMLEKMVGGLYFEQYINIRFMEELARISGASNANTVENVGFRLKNGKLQPEDLIEQITDIFDYIGLGFYFQEKMYNFITEVISEAKDRKYKICAGLLAGVIYKSMESNPRESTNYIFGLTGSGCKTEEFNSNVTRYITEILKVLCKSSSTEVSVEFKFSEEASLQGAASSYVYKHI
ncbi:glucokinase [Nematocida ausubeli]|nr:glucokinase [Nematocida ausubeli]